MKSNDGSDITCAKEIRQRLDEVDRHDVNPVLWEVAESMLADNDSIRIAHVEEGHL
jgi:hypothetical protein